MGPALEKGVFREEWDENKVAWIQAPLRVLSYDT